MAIFQLDAALFHQGGEAEVDFTHGHAHLNTLPEVLAPAFAVFVKKLLDRFV